MSNRSRHILKFLVRLGVTAVLLAWVISRVDFGQFAETIKAARWSYVIGAWLATASFFGVQALAMQRILYKQGCRVTIPTLFAASCVTALYGMVLPGILSAGAKWYILTRHTGRGSHVLSSMLYNQVMLSAVMIAIALVALMITNPVGVFLPDAQNRWLFPALCAALLVPVVSVPALLLTPQTASPFTKFVARLLDSFPVWLRDKGRTILAQLAAFQTAGFRFHLTVIAINLAGGLLIGALVYWFAAGAARVVVPLGVLIWLCEVVYILGRLPVSIANLGVREVTLVGVLGVYGVNDAAALLMSGVLFSALIFMAALGALCHLFWLPGPAESRGQIPGEAELLPPLRALDCR